MNCEKCEKELVKFASKGEVLWAEQYEDENGDLRYYEDCARGYGEEIRLLFCTECKTFYTNYVGPAHDDTYEYMNVEQEEDLEGILELLTEIIQCSPEQIDFVILKNICEILKIDISEVMKNIAFNIIEQQKPLVYIPGDEVPF